MPTLEGKKWRLSDPALPPSSSSPTTTASWQLLSAALRISFFSPDRQRDGVGRGRREPAAILKFNAWINDSGCSVPSTPLIVDWAFFNFLLFAGGFYPLHGDPPWTSHSLSLSL